MTSGSSPAGPVLVFSGFVLVLLAAVLLLPAACGLLVLGGGPEPDGRQNLGLAEQQLLRTARAAVRETVGDGVRFETPPELVENPVTQPCDGADTTRADDPRTSSYTWVLVGADPRRYATYAAALGSYLTARGWSAEGTGPGATWTSERATMKMDELTGPRRVVLEARTPCLRDDRP